MRKNNIEIITKKINAALAAALAAIDAGAPGALSVSISKGNSKMGDVWSVSLLPYITCPAGVHCKTVCYAAKLCNLRPSVLAAYARNTAILIRRPDLYWQQVRAAIATQRFFRFHVAGDIPNRAYLDEMVKAAEMFPECRIMAFTENHGVCNAYLDEHGEFPVNLRINYSGGYFKVRENPHNMPETRIISEKFPPASDWFICPGNCIDCACRGVACWSLEKGQTIAFKEH